MSRASLLIGASLLVHAAPAWTANECGVPPPGGGTVTCTPAGNPYPNGIDYDPPGGLVADLTVVLQPGVVVDNNGTPTNPNGVEIGSSAPGVDLSLQGGVNTQITTDAVFHDAVDVVATDGTVAVAVDDVDTTQANSRGIVASGRGTTSVTADTVGTLGDNADGISAEEGNFILPGTPATVGGTSVTVNSLSTGGANSTGIIAFSENGGVVVDVGTVTTGGNYSNAVLAIAATGDVRVTSDSITTEGTGSEGINAQIFPFPDEVVVGTVVVDSGSVATGGDNADGIVATSPVSNVTINSVSVSTIGNDAAGISAFITGQFVAPGSYQYGPGDILIDSGTITTLGDNAEGIVAIGTDGVTVISDSISAQGDQSGGIYAETYFDGAISITSGVVTTAGGTDADPSGGAHAIEARADEGSITITSTSVATGVAGAEAGADSIGIYATSNAGAININSGLATTTGAGAVGIFAETGPGSTPPPPPPPPPPPADIAVAIAPVATPPDISITSATVVTLGDDAIGIQAASRYGDIHIESGSITTVGSDATGIDAASETATVVVSSLDTVSTSGDRSVGIYAHNPVGGGTVTVTSNAVMTGGDFSSGILATGSVDVTVTSTSVSTAGLQSFGVAAYSDTGLVTITSGNVTTAGVQAYGIVGAANGNDLTVDSTGTIFTSGAEAQGIRASGAQVTIDSNIVTTAGGGATGISASSSGGNVAITSQQVTTTGFYAQGIAALTGPGNIHVVSTGTVSTADSGADAIAGQSIGGSVTIDSATVDTAGDQSIGISAISASGAINITSDSVATAGSGATGIYASTGDAAPHTVAAAKAGPTAQIAPVAVPPDISITSGTVSTLGEGAYGVQATTEDGDIYIESGSVTTGGNEATGILAETKYGSITIDSDTVSTTGPNATGIEAVVTGGPIDKYAGGTVHVTSDNVSVNGGSDAGALTAGINATGPNDVTIVSGTVTTSGGGVDGITAGSVNGAVVVTSDQVGTEGDFAQGILATSVYGNVEVTNTDLVETDGVESPGITAFAFYSGNVTVDSAEIVTHADESPAINAQSAYGDVAVTSDAITTSGNFSDGIFAIASSNVLDDEAIETLDGVVEITSGTIGTTGDGSGGIRAYGSSVTVVSSNVTTTGQTVVSDFGDVAPTGIYARSFGTRPAVDDPSPIAPGLTSVTSGSVSTAGDGAHGIHALADVGDTIVATSGTTATTGAGSYGILATTGSQLDGTYTGDGNVTVTSNIVATDGAGSDGIVARGGTVTVTSSSVTTAVAGSTGILAESFGAPLDGGGGGDALTSLAAGGDLLADIGVLAIGPGGTSVTSGSVTTTGADSSGIVAISALGDAEVISTGTVATAGANSTGITADTRTGGGSGAVNVAGNIVTTSGALSGGIFAIARTEVTVGSASVTTTGLDSNGIDVRSSNGNIVITSASVATAGQGSRGITVSGGSGNVDIASTGTVRTEGALADGIIAFTDGQASVDSNGVTTLGASANGIFVSAAGNVDVASESVVTSGNVSRGIFASSGTGDVGVASGAVSTAGTYSTGISAFGTNVTIASTTVVTTGANSPGISALSRDGGVEIVSAGPVTTTGASADGIVAESRMGGVIVDSGAVNVSGPGSEAIVVTSATTSNVTIRGLVQSGQSFALQANGGPATVNTVPGGTLRGRFDLTDGDDTVNNGGIVDVIGTSQLGGGGDVFNNNAGGTVRSVNGAGVIAGGETFNNRSLLDLRDGAPNDTLTLSGAFSGQAGSTLGLDVDFDAGTADVLILGTATGTTPITLQTTGSVFSLDNDGILVVDAGAGTGSGAFTLANAIAGNAYINVGLRFDPAAFNFLLVGGPNQPIFETTQIGEMTTALWYKTADAVGAQLDTSRDGGDGDEGGSALRGTGGGGVWVQVMASETENEAVQSFTGGGGPQTFDVEYEQQFEGLQGGVELASGPLRFGITGGFGSGKSVFEVTGNRVEIDVKNIGAYAEYRSGGLWVNGLVKMDWMDVATDPGPGLAAEFDAKSFGALINLGYRAEMGGFFVEPSAGIAWVNTEIDPYLSGGATIDFDDAESLRAHAGLRLGSVIDMGEGGATLAPYIGARAFEELADGNTNRFTLGQTIALGDDAPGTHGRAEAGFSLRSGGVEAFLRGELDFGGDTEGKGVRGGIRLRF